MKVKWETEIETTIQPPKLKELTKINLSTPKPWTINNQDVLTFCANYKGPLFHAILCDPPYHLTSIVKRFGSENSKPAKEGVYARGAKGFMGKTWDGGDVAFDPATWEALKGLLLPGAFGMAFASSRGWHRLAVAIEDAGFIIHPTIFGWLYGSGFPKATRIDTAIDKRLGLEREVVGYEKEASPLMKPGMGISGLMQAGSPAGEYDPNQRINLPITAPSSDLAKSFEAYRYGLQALKPALEPIIVFQKPYDGKSIDSIITNGAGALNIMGAKIGTEVHHNNGGLGDNSNMNDDGWSGVGIKSFPSEVVGRWPANFVVGSGLLPEENSKFFFNVETSLDSADPVFYCPKASKGERELGLESFKTKSAGELTNRKPGSAGLDGNKEKGYDHNPLASVTTNRKNTHPTIKPLSLINHLATLLLPPDIYSPRRLLIPFSGSGSEMIGALQAGWDYVEGVELETEYTKLAQARLEHYIIKGKE